MNEIKVMKCGVFVKMYGEGESSIVRYYVFETSDEASLRYWVQQGYTLIKPFDLEYTPLDYTAMAQVTADRLRAEITAKRAECEADITQLTGRINRLLALEYTPSTQEQGFAPRRTVIDAEDVYDHGGSDDTPF